MKLLKHIYNMLTEPIRNDIEKRRKVEENKILDRYRRLCAGKQKSKWDYSVMTKNMRRNNEAHETLLKHKLTKWEWLRKLV